MKVINVAMTGALLGIAQATPVATRAAITDGTIFPPNPNR